MSFSHLLLTQEEPLELWEIEHLQNWLAVLEADVNIFGPTPEDENTMNAIKKRLEKEANGKA